MEGHHLLLSGKFNKHNHNYGGLSLDGITTVAQSAFFESKTAVIQILQVQSQIIPTYLSEICTTIFIAQIQA